MIHFFSNHKDTADLERITGAAVEVIPHPYIEPEWTVEDIKSRCADVIERAVNADKLVINGDYTLVSLIVLERNRLGKMTGFMAMKKLNRPTTRKSNRGNIVNENVLRPVNIRWI